MFDIEDLAFNCCAKKCDPGQWELKRSLVVPYLSGPSCPVFKEIAPKWGLGGSFQSCHAGCFVCGLQVSIGLSAIPSSSPSNDVLATDVRRTVFPYAWAHWAGITACGAADRLQGG